MELILRKAEPQDLEALDQVMLVISDNKADPEKAAAMPKA